MEASSLQNVRTHVAEQLVSRGIVEIKERAVKQIQVVLDTSMSLEIA